MKKILVSTLLAALLGPSLAFADDVVGKVVQIKAVGNGSTDLQYQRKGQPWYAGFLDMQGQLHDKFKTNATTVAALEFIIGGRVGINKDSEIEIVTERSVADAKVNVKRIILRKGGMWAKTAKLKEPLEIQTNGGVMGIKGTEFVIDTQPSGDTSVSVLEGAVEVRDTQGKVLGSAQAGDTYKIYKDVKVHKAYEKTNQEPEKLRRDLYDSQEWRGANDALNLLNWMGAPIPAGIGFTGYYGSSAHDLFTMDFVNDPAHAVGVLLNAVSAAGGNVPGGGYISGGLGMFGGGGRKKPAAPDFPSELSPDSSPESQTAKTAKPAPDFKWKGFGDADGYVVLVSPTEDFKTIEWSARVKGGEEGLTSYPSNAAPLAVGKHFWRVIAVNNEDKPLDGKKGAQTFFEVAP